MQKMYKPFQFEMDDVLSLKNGSIITSKGYEFFVIYLKEEPLPFTFVIAAVIDGDVEYYDSNDYEQFENLGNPQKTGE